MKIRRVANKTKIMNKRRAKRVDCYVPVEGKEGSAFSAVQTIDFSKTGIGFVSDSKIPIDQEIAMEIVLSETDEPVIVIGKVKWVTPIKSSKKYRIGLEFDELRRGSKSRLDQYFKSKRSAKSWL